MNIKLKNNKIYFKLQKNELEEVENNNTLVDSLFFDNKTKLTINLSLASESKIELLQKNDASVINCQITKENIQTLKDMGKNKDGLTIKGAKSSFIVQLNLKQRD